MREATCIFGIYVAISYIWTEIAEHKYTIIPYNALFLHWFRHLSGCLTDILRPVKREPRLTDWTAHDGLAYP